MVLNCGVLRVPVVHLLTRIDSQIRDLTCLWSPRGLAYRTADPSLPLPPPVFPRQPGRAPLQLHLACLEAKFAERVQLIESEAHAFFDKQLKHFVPLLEVLGYDQAPGRLAEPTCRRKLTCLRNRM